MKITGRPVWKEIYLDHIKNNLTEIRKFAKDKKIISVIKDDAYGHGAFQVLKKIEHLSDFFGCACVKEALLLKKLTNKKFIIFGGFFEKEIKYLDDQIIPVVYDFDQLKSLIDSGGRYRINLEFDSGMGRTGFMPSDTENVINLIKRNKNIGLFGLMSHFAAADSDRSFTRMQIDRFSLIINQFLKNGLKPEIIHIANSAGIFYKTPISINAVRPGIMLYGGYPAERLRLKIKLTPAMSFKTRIISLKEVPANTPISYGCTYHTRRKSIIATLSVGYGDGYFRCLSNKGLVYIKGKGIAKVIGRVCMDMTMVDVTNIRDVKKGDDVVLWGFENPDVHPDKIAELAGTISYELFCAVAKRVKRVFK